MSNRIKGLADMGTENIGHKKDNFELQVFDEAAVKFFSCNRILLSSQLNRPLNMSLRRCCLAETIYCFF